MDIFGQHSTAARLAKATFHTILAVVIMVGIGMIPVGRAHGGIDITSDACPRPIPTAGERMEFLHEVTGLYIFNYVWVDEWVPRIRSCFGDVRPNDGIFARLARMVGV